MHPDKADNLKKIFFGIEVNIFPILLIHSVVLFWHLLSLDLLVSMAYAGLQLKLCSTIMKVIFHRSLYTTFFHCYCSTIPAAFLPPFTTIYKPSLLSLDFLTLSVLLTFFLLFPSHPSVPASLSLSTLSFYTCMPDVGYVTVPRSLSFLCLNPPILILSALSVLNRYLWLSFLFLFFILFSIFCPLRSLPSVLWRCWLGGRKGTQPVKNLSGEVLEWLSVWSEMQTCI